jgi:hypothetical protein
MPTILEQDARLLAEIRQKIGGPATVDEDEMVLRIARTLVSDPAIHETVIRAWALGMLCGTAQDDTFMQAYLNLTEVGPANNHDGKRGTALTLKRQIEDAILMKATALCREMRSSVEAIASAYRLNSQVYEITSVHGKRRVTVGSEMELKLHHYNATEDQSYELCVLPEGYLPIDSSIPEDVEIHVVWGSFPTRLEFGCAKWAHGKWWIYGQSNPHANGRECASPIGWSKTFRPDL